MSRPICATWRGATLLLEYADRTRQAIRCFEQAVEIDPDYALAYAGIADCYVVMADWRYIPQVEGNTKARQAALKALELDDTLAEPHELLAIAIAELDSDYERAKAEMELDLELNPVTPRLTSGMRPCFCGWVRARGRWRRAAGRFAEATEQSHKVHKVQYKGKVQCKVGYIGLEGRPGNRPLRSEV